ncbi:MAG: hypothetical protein AB8F74_01305, partial [Saprospiraceae bacterium]
SDANGCVSASVYNYGTVTTNPCDTSFWINFNVIDTVGVTLIYADVADGGIPPFTYEWSTGETSHVIETSTSGTYSLTVTDANGCTTSNSTNVTVNNNNPCDNFGVTIYSNPDSLGMGQDFLVAIANGGTWPVAYSWSTGETGGGIEITGTTETSFSVTATDANGCVAEDDIEL